MSTECAIETTVLSNSTFTESKTTSKAKHHQLQVIHFMNNAANINIETPASLCSVKELFLMKLICNLIYINLVVILLVMRLHYQTFKL